MVILFVIIINSRKFKFLKSLSLLFDERKYWVLEIDEIILIEEIKLNFNEKFLLRIILEKSSE